MVPHLDLDLAKALIVSKPCDGKTWRAEREELSAMESQNLQQEQQWQNIFFFSELEKCKANSELCVPMMILALN